MRPTEMVPKELMEMECDRAEMYRDQLLCAQQKILGQKKRLRELERLAQETAPLRRVGDWLDAMPGVLRSEVEQWDWWKKRPE